LCQGYCRHSAFSSRDYQSLPVLSSITSNID
jgi:hypothetical protein